MYAAVTTRPLEIQLEEQHAPDPTPNEAVVRMKAAGICGSDIHFYDGTHPYANYPRVYGHELCGVVESTGPGCSNIDPGDRVVVDPGIPCGKCYACRTGKPNCCKDLTIIGVHRPGGFASFVPVPEDHLHRIPDDMSYEIGALCEPFTIGAQIVSRAQAKPGNTVTILGMGPIGLTALIHLKQSFDVEVFAVDIVEERLQRAASFGADHPIDANDQDVRRTIDEMTRGEGSNIVIEAAGIPATMEQTVDLVSAGGRIVIAGLTNENVTLPGIVFTKKELEIFGSRLNTGRFPDVIRFLDAHQGIAEAFVTRQMPFEEISEAFRVAKTEPDKINKIILQF